MDAPKEANISKVALNNYSTALRKEFKFVEELNSMACQSATERAWSAIDRFYSNCKSKGSRVCFLILVFSASKRSFDLLKPQFAFSFKCFPQAHPTPRDIMLYRI
jgi:hypothetical protein